MMWKIYVGNLHSRTRERELADEFRAYGNVRSVWVARNPPGYAFVELDDGRDAEDAIAALDGKHGWRVEMSKKNLGGISSYNERGSRRSHRRSTSPYSRTDGSSITRSERDDWSPRSDRRSSYQESPRKRGRDYDRHSGSDRSESRGSRKRHRERSLSLEDPKLDGECSGRRQPSKSPQAKKPDGSGREHELSRSPRSIRSASAGSPVKHEHDHSPPNLQDGSPTRNGRGYSKSPSQENDSHKELERSSVLCERSQSPPVQPRLSDDGIPVMCERSQSPPNLQRLTEDGSPVTCEPSQSLPNDQRLPEDGSPAKNGGSHCKSDGKSNSDAENERSPLMYTHGRCPSDPNGSDDGSSMERNGRARSRSPSEINSDNENGSCRKPDLEHNGHADTGNLEPESR